MFPKDDKNNSIILQFIQVFIRMGTACSFFGSGSGSNSYDLPGRKSPCHEAQSAHDLTFDEKQTQCRSESRFTNNEQIVSQSQCEVNITMGSSHMRDSDLENSKTVNDAKTMNQTSALESVPSQPTVNAEERLLVEDFKPGHVSHVDNALEKQTSGHAKTSGVDELLKILAKASDEEIEKVVDKCWQDIESTCRNQRNHDRTSSSTELKTKGWRVVRLFVSSTFADYHAEREVLVKKVRLTSVRYFMLYLKLSLCQVVMHELAGSQKTYFRGYVNNNLLDSKQNDFPCFHGNHWGGCFLLHDTEKCLSLMLLLELNYFIIICFFIYVLSFGRGKG